MEKNEMWVGGIAGLKKNFIELLKSSNRERIDSVIEWLIYSDFFTAPASSEGHNNYPGGLAEHSLNVYFILKDLVPEGEYDQQSIIITSLLHDVCKINFYKSDVRNKKIDGQWVQEPYISIDDTLPLGHGEKSVILLQRFIDLSLPEIMAIRWHMGGFDDSARQYAGGKALTKAMSGYPLITYLHCADLLSCIEENKP